MVSIEEITTFCKKKGLVFPSAEIYGGMSGFFDYGPLGVELKNNIKGEWWKRFVNKREDVVGLDGSIITNPKVWKASGHLENFDDILVEDMKTKERYRADHLIEDSLKISAEGLSAEDLWKLIQENKVLSPKGNHLSKPAQFNLMFSTNVGPVESESSKAYMRPETAQSIFANFRLVQESSRMKLPFGIAQIGKVFRNEISPRDFLFRSREFEQMEIEYFIDPNKKNEFELPDKLSRLQIRFLSKEVQVQGGGGAEETTFAKLIEKGKLSRAHAFWLAESFLWYVEFGVRKENLRVREHRDDEISHYSTATFDIEYLFPFGWKEIHGNADRGTYDLTQHQEFSKTKLSVFDDESADSVLPSVIEPSYGVDRAFLTFLFDAYENDKSRGNIVLKLHPKIAPVTAAVFPLVKNKPELVKKARVVFGLINEVYPAQYDESGSIGRRYARADEIGIPLCITVDFDSLDDGTVTVRDRDSTKQARVKIEELSGFISGYITNYK